MVGVEKVCRVESVVVDDERGIVVNRNEAEIKRGNKINRLLNVDADDWFLHSRQASLAACKYQCWKRQTYAALSQIRLGINRMLGKMDVPLLSQDL